MSFAEMAAAPLQALAGGDMPLANAAVTTGRGQPKPQEVEYTAPQHLKDRYFLPQTVHGAHSTSKSFSNSGS